MRRHKNKWKTAKRTIEYNDAIAEENLNFCTAILGIRPCFFLPWNYTGKLICCLSSTCHYVFKHAIRLKIGGWLLLPAFVVIVGFFLFPDHRSLAHPKRINHFQEQTQFNFSSAFHHFYSLFESLWIQLAYIQHIDMMPHNAYTYIDTHAHSKWAWEEDRRSKPNDIVFAYDFLRQIVNNISSNRTK